MKVIFANNVNDAVAQALPYLLDSGIREDSRNGAVLVAPGPVTTVYTNPLERVLFSPRRDANPFFHVMESLWMLAGRNDVDFPAKFAKRLATYSDDGKILWGAYGWRWREFFGYDQLPMIISELKVNPDSRRCVLSMWNGYAGDELHGESDLHHATGKGAGKDVPCNTHAYFDVRGGKLNMTVCNRSNDAIWGCYGANSVHFGFLLEYMAEQVGVPVGVYRQISNNFHAYTEHYSEVNLRRIAEESTVNLYRTYGDLPIIPLGSMDGCWNEDLYRLVRQDNIGKIPFKTKFFRDVAEPMYMAWEAHKEGDREETLHFLVSMPMCDWKVAAIEWVMRRKEKANAA